jgi:hypothetical protein
VEDVAGTGVGGTAPTGRAGTLQLFGPNDVAADAAGNLYVSETSHRIRLVPASGASSTLAGSNAPSRAGRRRRRDRGPASACRSSSSWTRPAARSTSRLHNFRVRRVPLDPAQPTTSVVGTTQTSTGFKNGRLHRRQDQRRQTACPGGDELVPGVALGVVRRARAAAASPRRTAWSATSPAGTWTSGPRTARRCRRACGARWGAGGPPTGALWWVERDDGKLRKLAGGVVTTVIGLAGGGSRTGRSRSPSETTPATWRSGRGGTTIYIVESLNHVGCAR